MNIAESSASDLRMTTRSSPVCMVAWRKKKARLAAGPVQSKRDAEIRSPWCSRYRP
jgi:hypothetical protein